jgi:group II intron reverse transcriptase/maturase
LRTSTKSFAISKRLVYEAWKRVKANRGSAGIDTQSVAKFEENLSRNLYKVWNRMASGSYFPPPVMEVNIPKQSGGIRTLGIPTVGDRVAQTAVKMHLEPLLEPHFDEDSYGYRPGRSAKDAVAVTRKRCWKTDWVVELDVKGAFDHLDHDLLMKAVRKHTDCPWVLLYIERWLQVPSMTADGALKQRSRGTPQGGVVSPLLMNLFMHYAFDRWMRENVTACPFARYADDAVVHCRTEQQANRVKQLLTERFAACGLELHPDKTGIVYCKDSNRRGPYPTVQFTFLGFTFRPRRAVSPDGKQFTSFLPGASAEAQKRMRQQIHSWRLSRQTPGTLAEFSDRYNAILRGWWHYYGGFYPAAVMPVFQHFDLTLARWARRKFKRMAGRGDRSRHWIAQVARREPQLFIHWSAWYAKGRTMGAV